MCPAAPSSLENNWEIEPRSVLLSNSGLKRMMKNSEQEEELWRNSAQVRIFFTQELLDFLSSNFCGGSMQRSKLQRDSSSFSSKRGCSRKRPETSSD